jgi:predicted XRE-type DNA-binding protein
LSENQQEFLNQIEKTRYLIPCKCSICAKSFPDIIVGSRHVSEQHPRREKRNVVENLTWDVKTDLKHWEILQSLRLKRDRIISKLKDDNAIMQAKIPEVIDIARKKVNVLKLIETLEVDLSKKEEKASKKDESEEEEVEEEIRESDFGGSEDDSSAEEAEADSSAEESESGESEEVLEEYEEEEEESSESASKDSKTSQEIEVITNKEEITKLTELLEHEVDKFLRGLKRISMAGEVKRVLESKKGKSPMLYKMEKQIDYYLGISKAIETLKYSK